MAEEEMEWFWSKGYKFSVTQAEYIIEMQCTAWWVYTMMQNCIFEIFQDDMS